MAEDKVKITLAHPLSAEHAERIGLEKRDYPVRSKISVGRDGADRLIAVGYATVDPEDLDAVAAVLNPQPPEPPASEESKPAVAAGRR